MSPVRSSEVLDVLLDIELRHNIAAWRIDGVCVWPLARVWLHVNILNSALHDEAPPSTRSELYTRAQRLVRARLRVSRASWQDRSSNARLGAPVEAVFLSDGVSFVRVEGLWYEKFFDPIIGWLRDHNARSLLLTPLNEAHHPRRSASMFIQPRLDSIKLRALLRKRVAGKVELMGFDAALSGTQMTAARLMRLWVRLSALCDYFTGILQKARPRRAFVNTYYSIEGMAFVLACRRCNVRVVDVQHGVQGDYHVAYGQWSHLPAGGYDLLPDEFWVWSDAERRAIEAWRPATGDRHLPVVIGNAWLELWRTESDRFVLQAIGDAQRLRQAAASCCVLVTLQWGLPQEETLKLLRAIALAPGDIQWWLRLHPVVAHERRPMHALIEEYRLRNVDIDGPTDLPLHALLKVSDLHVTHSSSTVIEAAEFAVPSIVTSDYGAQIFQEQLASGVATVATTDSAIAAAVCDLAGQGRRRAELQPAQDQLSQALAHSFSNLDSPGVAR